MEKTYDLNELAMMTGFTTRTLRSYLSKGLLKGNMTDGKWQFTAEDLDAFFHEPYIREGMRIRRNSTVFDFLADTDKKGKRACLILDLPVSLAEGQKISSFFCNEMQKAEDVFFTFGHDRGQCRVILSGDLKQVMRIAEAYGSSRIV